MGLLKRLINKLFGATMGASPFDLNVQNIRVGPAAIASATTERLQVDGTTKATTFMATAGTSYFADQTRFGTPSLNLESVNSTSGVFANNIVVGNGVYIKGTGPQQAFYKFNGTVDAQTATVDGNNLGQFVWNALANDGTTFDASAYIQVNATQTPNTTTVPSKITFYTTRADGTKIPTVAMDPIGLNFGVTGNGKPAFTNRSAGTKVVLGDRISGSATDYAIGIEDNGTDGYNTWFGTPNTGTGFRWYGGTSVAATLTGAGNLTTTGTIVGTTMSGYPDANSQFEFGTQNGGIYNTNIWTVASDNAASGVYDRYVVAKGTIASPTALTSGRLINSVEWQGCHTNAGYAVGFRQNVEVASAPSATSVPMKWRVGPYDPASPPASYAFTVFPSGRMAMGTDTEDTSSLLFVNGGITAVGAVVGTNLPSPGGGDTAKVLTVTGAGTATWQVPAGAAAPSGVTFVGTIPNNQAAAADVDSTLNWDFTGADPDVNPAGYRCAEFDYYLEREIDSVGFAFEKGLVTLMVSPAGSIVFNQYKSTAPDSTVIGVTFSGVVSGTTAKLQATTTNEDSGGMAAGAARIRVVRRPLWKAT